MTAGGEGVGTGFNAYSLEKLTGMRSHITDLDPWNAGKMLAIAGERS